MEPKDIDKGTYRDEVAALFRTLPAMWIGGDNISWIGGKAWRTRVGDCRTQLGMVIENRHYRELDGSNRSQYRYLPVEYTLTAEVTQRATGRKQ